MVDRPQKPVVIYDGTCGICAGNLKWLYRLDTLKKFDATPYQADDLLRLFPHLKIEECQQTMHLVFPDGRTYKGADAFRQVFLRMPLMFLVGVLLSIPPLPWVLRKLYPILARNRYRIGGKCELPVQPELKDEQTIKSR
jgi:predicted DCC family thiol-disulfide oxidoreductase YuxK